MKPKTAMHLISIVLAASAIVSGIVCMATHGDPMLTASLWGAYWLSYVVILAEK